MIFSGFIRIPLRQCQKCFVHSRWGHIAYQFCDQKNEGSILVRIAPPWLPIDVDFCAIQKWSKDSSSYQETDQKTGKTSLWTIEGSNICFQRVLDSQKTEEYCFKIPPTESEKIVTPLTLFDLINSVPNQQTQSLDFWLIGKSELLPVSLICDVLKSKKTDGSLWQIKMIGSHGNQWTEQLVKQIWFLKHHRDFGLSKIILNWGIHKIEWEAKG